MGLKIYESADPSAAFSTDATFTNPLASALNGANGDVLQRRCYIRNDDSTRWYSSITLQPIDGGDNIVNGSRGYSWKLYAGDSQPLDEQWDMVSAGNSISLSNIGSSSAGDTTTYLPFWVRIEVPQRAPVESFQGVVLRVSATENLV